ncbi:hypothetical protein HID58_088258, partial [Brassica napus]
NGCLIYFARQVESGTLLQHRLILVAEILGSSERSFRYQLREHGRISGACFDAERGIIPGVQVENPHYIQQPYFKIHLSEGFSFKNLRGYLLCRALDGRQTYIFLVDGGLRRRSPAYVQLLHFQTMGQEHAQGPESFRYEGINRWENMDGLENSTVTSVENYTVMKWHVDCLHYTRVPFNYHI